MPEIVNDLEFKCKCCGQCCRRDPYYAVSLLDIRNISMGLRLQPQAFFERYCAVMMTPGGFRYPVILAPDGCPFLRDQLCVIHLVKPIGCWVFPESALLTARELKRHMTAIGDCAIMDLPNDDRPLRTDHELLAARDLQFEHTKKYFEDHEEFEETPWQEATDRLIEKLQDSEELERRTQALRARANSMVTRSQSLI
ncbi:MAG TPA: YkgJ family cysteine cluster protein [Methanocella sp.]|nr:YkgJ family cysteine cluster protein [Methanocella sp.]